MKLSEFDYNLDPSLIAQEPAVDREKSRLLALSRQTGLWEHKESFAEIVGYLKPGDVLVLNNTRVMNARLLGVRRSGGKVDALVVFYEKDRAYAMIQTTRRPTVGEIYHFGPYEALVGEREKDGWRLDFRGVEVLKIMQEIGLPPLPPYIKRKGEARQNHLRQDEERYQTIYAKTLGSIAAPTAGLHFTESILAKIREKGIEIVSVTLHVGLGTFVPVKTEEIEQHPMHTEYYEITEKTADTINSALSEKRRIIATGTTSCRTLETAGKSGRVVTGHGQTNIFIYPGFSFQIVGALITNFHVPKSTLIMLVSAFAGKDLIFRAYEDAIAQRYRFYSYGDAMFIY